MPSAKDDKAKALDAIADAFGVDLEKIDVPADDAPKGLADHKSPEEIRELVDDWLNRHTLEQALWVSHTVLCGRCAKPFVTMMKKRLEREGF